MKRAHNSIRLRQTWLDQKGAVLVEMAFTLPILALIFLNIIDLGLMIRQYQILQNAAREGARISIQPLNQIFFRTAGTECVPSNLIKDRVVDYCAQEKITITRGDVTINQTYAPCASEITVTYTRPMLLMGAPLLPTNLLTLTGRSIFSNFYGCAGTSTYPTGVTCP
jgi:hypothetical protein